MTDTTTLESSKEKQRKRTVTFRNEVDTFFQTHERSEDETRRRWYTDQEIRKMKKKCRAILNCYHLYSRQSQQEQPIELLGIEDPRRTFEKMKRREYHIKHVLKKQSMIGMDQIDNCEKQYFIDLIGH